MVIDCFSDLDTQYYAEKCFSVTSLAIVHLSPILEQLNHLYVFDGLVYGSGFEQYPESLGVLATHFKILGNAPEVFNRLLDKADFFKQLDKLAIAHPVVSFEPPDDDGWLIKPMRGQGGMGIKAYVPGSVWPVNDDVYWQRFQQGSSHSVLFLARQGNAQIIGFNQQWCGGADHQAFLFAGVRSYVELSRQQKALLLAWVQQLVEVFGLKGMNTLDFILAGEQCLVLEVNPRPSASMQLYSAEWILAHMQACTDGGALAPENKAAYSDVIHRAYQVIYAVRPTKIPIDFEWPIWCFDLPRYGTIIATSQPICSIIADGQSWQHVETLLSALQQSILDKLTKSV